MVCPPPGLFINQVMVSAIKIEYKQEKDHFKKITVPLDSFKDKNFEDFVTNKSMILLRMMQLSYGFLTVDLDLWKDRGDFRLAKEKVKLLKVVNNHAERRVALIQEFCSLLTRDESHL